MAYKIEDIYKAFVEAMSEYNIAMAAVEESVKEMKSAEKKLQKAFDDLSLYMGEQPPYGADPGRASDPFNLDGIVKGESGFDSFLGGIAGLF